MIDRNSVLVAGIGSDFGDDRLGWLVVERLAESSLGCTLMTLRKPLDLLDRLTGFEELHLVDACHSAAALGTIERFNWPVSSRHDLRFGGTHDLDLISTLQLAERLGTLPARVTIWTIAVAPTTGDPAAGLSAVVVRSIDRLVARLRRELVPTEEAARLE